jgi:hypothetical protein
VRPAPQGRAYRERRHFCHVTILLSSEPAEAKQTKTAVDGKDKPVKLAESKGRKRGGAVAAPRAKRVAPKTEAEPKAATTGKADEGKAANRVAKQASPEEKASD